MKYTTLVLILFVSLFLTFSCSNKSSVPQAQDENSNPAVGDDIPSEVATSVFDKAPITTKGAPQIEEPIEDCHGKRKVDQTIEDVNASIVKIGDKYVIATNGGNSRYLPCEIPGRLKKEGLLVRFSGEVLEIFPNERLIATPFRLKNIVERD
jgi:hypothetical protein